MNKQKYRRLVLLLIMQLAVLAASSMAASRVDIGLDEQWKFIRQDVADAAATNFDDTAWQSVNLPHTWNNLDGQTSGIPYYRGIGWYRRHLLVDAQYAGKSLFLKFDGAATWPRSSSMAAQSARTRGTSRRSALTRPHFCGLARTM